MKNLIPYLIINGKCEQALSFYQNCFNGRINFIQRYRDTTYEVSENFKDMIAHAEFEADTFKLYFSDGFEHLEATASNNIAMTVSFDNEPEQRAVFKKLKQGGQVTLDFTQTSVESSLVTLIDQFEIHWYLNLEKPEGR
jgi:PhnB protein